MNQPPITNRGPQSYFRPQNIINHSLEDQITQRIIPQLPDYIVNKLRINFSTVADNLSSVLGLFVGLYSPSILLQYIQFRLRKLTIKYGELSESDFRKGSGPMESCSQAKPPFEL